MSRYKYYGREEEFGCVKGSLRYVNFDADENACSSDSIIYSSGYIMKGKSGLTYSFTLCEGEWLLISGSVEERTKTLLECLKMAAVHEKAFADNEVLVASSSGGKTTLDDLAEEVAKGLENKVNVLMEEVKQLRFSVKNHEVNEKHLNERYDESNDLYIAESKKVEKLEIELKDALDKAENHKLSDYANRDRLTAIMRRVGAADWDSILDTIISTDKMRTNMLIDRNTKIESLESLILRAMRRD